MAKELGCHFHDYVTKDYDFSFSSILSLSPPQLLTLMKKIAVL